MTKTKTTKRALLASAISLLLCFSMLLGTTYAWFTDSVTSAGNIIKSGTLEVGMYWAEGEEAVPTEDSGWKDASTEAIFNYEKWEPGYVQVRHIKIANEGTLALKYKLQIVANGEVSDLADVIDVYYLDPAAQVAERADLANAKKLGTLSAVLANIASTDNTATGTLAAETSHNVTLALKMQESAGNQYQDKSIGSTFSVKLLATQVEAEFDSFDDQYDKFADYDGEISGEASLAAAFANGGTYKVIGNVTMTEAISVEAGKEVNLDLDGNTVTGSIELAAGASLTVINGSLESADSSASAIQNNGGELVLEDVEIASARHGVRVEGGEVTINSGTYTVAANGAKLTQHALNVSDGATVNVYDGTFVGPKGTGADSGSAVNVQAGSTVNIYGGSFSGGLNHTLSSKGTLNVYGGTFDQDPSAYLADGYATIQNADGTYTVMKGVAASDEASLADAIANGADTVVLAAGTYKMPAAVKNKTVTISGTKDTVIDVSKGLTYINGADVTFDGVTIKSAAGTGYNYGFADAKNTVFNNCVIEGTLGLDYSCEFNNCTFNVSGNNYNLWTWGAGTATFNGCTFNCDGKAMLVYANVLDNGTAHQTVNINGCTFNDNGDDTVTGKAAIEITNTYANPVRTYDVNINNTTVNGFAQTVPGAGDFNAAYGSVAGSNIGTNVWGNKCELPNTQINVVIDGVDVY